MRVLLLLLLAAPLGAADWAAIYDPPPTPRPLARAGVEETTEATPLQLKAAERKLADLEKAIRELKAAQLGDCPDGRCATPAAASFPAAAKRPAADPLPANPSHTCPTCGYTSPAGQGTWVVRGWLADGEHVHTCPKCGQSWRH